jgi:predicted transcriptional regulator
MMDKEKVLRILAKEWGVLPQQEDEFSTKDILEAIRELGAVASEGHIQRKLKKVIQEGFLTKRAIKSHAGGGHMNVYSPAEGKTWEDVLQYIKVS